MGKIAELMLKEHGQMLSILNSFDKNRTEELFSEMYDKQRKHMLAEERAIFIFDKKHQIFPALTKILVQHEELDNMINELKDDRKKDITNFKKLMKEHITLEDRDFYPLLDKKLNPKEQEEMLAKVKEYILGSVIAKED